MYSDDFVSHPLPREVRKVLVLEGGENPDDVIDKARFVEAVSRSMDGDEIFWVVFPDNARRAWDFTERALRQELTKLYPRK